METAEVLTGRPLGVRVDVCIPRVQWEDPCASNAYMGRAGAHTTRCWRGCRRVTKQGVATGSSNGGDGGSARAVQWRGAGWVECGECGRRAPLLWSGGPHRRAAEVALLAPLGGARRSREWSQ
jgi:hypothetical protein